MEPIGNIVSKEFFKKFCSWPGRWVNLAAIYQWLNELYVLPSIGSDTKYLMSISHPHEELSF
jgi:hypothetical protein